MYIIVSPENLDRGPLAAESRRITPNQAKSHLWSFTYKVIHWLNTRWAGEPDGRFTTTSFYPLPTHYPQPTHIPNMIHWFP